MNSFYSSLRIFLLANRIPNRIYILFFFLLISFNSNSQIVFWTETFDGTVCAAGSGCDPSIVVWNRVSLGGEGANANRFYVSCQENGSAAGVCGSGCGTDQSLHIGNVSTSSAAFLFCPSGDCGAAYDATGAGEVANTRCESPTVSCVGYSTITLNYNWIERGQNLLDNASVWYFDGTSWAFLYETPKTVNTGCSGQGRWTASISIALPASANNNPNVKIGFRWVNNGDGAGGDPSFAVDDVTLSYLTPLPIELISFSAVRVEKEKVKLNWITQTETNNDFFTIEKSIDGQNFIPIANKDGSGNSNQIINYIEYDNKADAAFVFYRLKQTDFNGEFSYSNIVKINNLDFKENDLVLFPNPANDEVSVLLSENYEKLNFVLMDIQGRIIQEMNILETNKISFDLNGIPEGVYLIQVIADGNSMSKKLFISK